MNRAPRLLALLAGVVIYALPVVAQEPAEVLATYQDRFSEASLQIKLQILNTADALPVEELGPLYLQGLQYVLSNEAQIESNNTVREMALVSVGLIGDAGYSAAVPSLWDFFEGYSDNTARLLTLNVLGEVGVGNDQLVVDVNEWVQAQANLYRSGRLPDRQVLDRAAEVLGLLGSPSSFPVLLDLQLAQISETITSTAGASMRALEGDFVQTAIDAINRRSIGERRPALIYFLNDSSLSQAEHAQIAGGVLAEAMRNVVRDPQQITAWRDLRFDATKVLMAVSYPDADEPLIEHLNETFRSYSQGRVAKTWVLEAIAALANTGTDAAAERLTTLLDLLNNYTENDRPYDTQIVLAVINNLGRMGNMVAYDALVYVTLLNYSFNVIDAARSAVDAITR